MTGARVREEMVWRTLPANWKSDLILCGGEKEGRKRTREGKTQIAQCYYVRVYFILISTSSCLGGTPDALMAVVVLYAGT